MTCIIQKKKRDDGSSHRPFKKLKVFYLHFSQSYRACRTNAGTGLAAFAKVGLLSKGLPVLHHKNTDRTVIYTLFAALAFCWVNRNKIHAHSSFESLTRKSWFF